MSKNRGESIFKQYSSALKRFISRQLSSDSESEDVLHDLFYKFLVTDGEEESIENVSSWLYRSARNLLIDRSRKKKEQEMPYFSHGNEDNFAQVSLAELLLYDDTTPDSELFRSIIREELNTALSELPEQQRKVFELNELQGIQFKEISEVTGLSINTLISQKRYAIQYLKKRLVELYD